MLQTYQDSPAFANNQIFAAADYNVLRSNLQTLDRVTLLGRVAFSRYAATTADNPAKTDADPLSVWYGSFEYTTSATTATVVTWSASVLGTETYQVYFDGVLRGSITAANGNQAITINNINTFGYNEGQVVDVDVRLVGTNTASQYQVWDAYISPLALSDAWPGVPTFGAISSANLNQLSNAIDWIARRVNLQRFQPFFTVRKFPGLFWSPTTWPIWSGTITRSTNATQLVLRTWYSGAGGYTEFLELLVNGAVVQSIGPISGDSGATFIYDMSGIAVGALAAIQFRSTVTAGAGNDTIRTRHSIVDCFVQDPAPTYQTQPPVETATGSDTFATVQSQLNSLATNANALKSRIDSNTDRWSRRRFFRRRYGLDGPGGFQQEYYTPIMFPQRARLGDLLIVKGQNIGIGWGSFGLNVINDEPGGHIGVEWTQNENLIGADAAETVRIGFDRFAGLYPGKLYAITGTDVRYVAEQLLQIG
ncbi:MAG: hypothetical protein MI924_10680 [Chloroflexales bacterium]|nr:hypothetical protein [Chloroflexales bacterium]